ncbi:MAG: hypothetical protein KBS83_06190, partial [Lachnospiraceae bacterium]|nr:hypothetical protein [Candidatus Equihabitans merdae]
MHKKPNFYNRIKAVLALCLTTCLMIGGLTGCGSSREAGAPEVLEAQEYNGVLAPTEYNGPEDAGGEANAQAADDAIGEGGSSSVIAPDDADSYMTNNGSNLIYVILPSEEGQDAIERDILRQRLAEAGYSMTWRTYDGQIENQTGAIEEAGLVRARAII